MGTWIEIDFPRAYDVCDPSFPTWERGLKCFCRSDGHFSISVVPHVGTWIEIIDWEKLKEIKPVVPHVGTWIEIFAVLRFAGTIARRSPRGNVD